MKRMLARGYPDIFQICKAFRAEEKGCRHNPEFTLVEWYRLGFSLLKMMEETVELCRLIIGPRPEVRFSYTEAFSSATGLNPISAGKEQLTSHPAIAAHGLTPGHFPETADVLNFLMSEVVEPTFNPEVLTVIHGFPSVLPSQALPDPGHPGTSLRFEVFGGRMELGNGYQELINPGEYRRRFEAENRKRLKAGKLVPPLDERCFSDMRDGLPPCSGVALGLDRLICLALGENNIDAILEFPWEDS
jgi:elongation factor P--(R)-beta-lysine ligase